MDGKEPSGSSQRVRSLLERLRSGDVPTQESAVDELQELCKAKVLTTSEGLELLRATTLEFPEGVPSMWGTPAWIIAALVKDPRREYVSVIEELFPRWDHEPRVLALDLLAGIDDTAAAEAFMRLLGEHAAEISTSPLSQLQRHPHHREVFFPGLLELAKHEALADDVYHTAIGFCEAGMLSPADLIGHAAPIVARYRGARDWLQPKQREEGAGWMWEDDYQEQRIRAGLLLDLFGYLPIDEVEDDLREATSLKDPRLVHYAIVSLLRHGKPVATGALDTVGASAEMRSELHDALKELDRMDLFPARHLTQEALAESEMVRWLTYPTELGRVPDQIELKKVVSADTEGPDGILDYYVFRFRTFKPHWAAKNGWMAGVAGPFLRKNAPSSDAHGGTFSTFEAWKAKSPAKHAGDIRELLEEWAEYHGRR